MRRHRARGGAWALVYLALRGVLGLVVAMMRSGRVNQVEQLTLRHKIAVLRRQVSGLRTSPPTVPSWRR